MPKRIVFLGSKPIGYHCLNHMAMLQEALDIEITGLLTQTRKEFGDDNDLHEIAQQYNIPLINSLDELPECDILYSVQYHQILKEAHIDKAGQIAVNLHMAPLPEYRGSNQFSYAIIEEKTEFGTTIHQIDTRIDHGAIMFQKRFEIPGECWVSDLYQLTYDASLALFKETLANIVHEDYTLIPQSVLAGQYDTALHFRNEIADLKKIDLGWSKEKKERHIRATYMPGFEPPYCIIDDKKVYFSTHY